MPISYTYNLVFIHIPKCAGTTIEKIIGTSTKKEFYSLKPRKGINNIKTPQHLTYREILNTTEINWKEFYIFTVVRNPYSRFVSEYNYRKELFAKTKRAELDPGLFSNFVNSLQMSELDRIKFFDGHLETQSSYLKSHINMVMPELKSEEDIPTKASNPPPCCPQLIDPNINIFKFENLAPCWAMLEEKTGVKYSNYLWSRKSNDNTPYQDFYTPEIKNTVYNFYKEDFDNFGYNSEL